MSHTSKITIPGKLPTLNEIIAASKVRGSSHNKNGKQWNRYATLKRAYHTLIQSVVGKPDFCHECFTVEYTYYRPDRRSDPSNVHAGAEKVILDTFEEIGLIAGDGHKNHRGSKYAVLKDKNNPRTIIQIVEAKDVSRTRDQNKSLLAGDPWR